MIASSRRPGRPSARRVSASGRRCCLQAATGAPPTRSSRSPGTGKTRTGMILGPQGAPICLAWQVPSSRRGKPARPGRLSRPWPRGRYCRLVPPRVRRPGVGMTAGSAAGVTAASPSGGSAATGHGGGPGDGRVPVPRHNRVSSPEAGIALLAAGAGQSAEGVYAPAGIDRADADVGLATWAPDDADFYRQRAAFVAEHGYAASTLPRRRCRKASSPDQRNGGSSPVIR